MMCLIIGFKKINKIIYKLNCIDQNYGQHKNDFEHIVPIKRNTIRFMRSETLRKNPYLKGCTNPKKYDRYPNGNCLAKTSRKLWSGGVP